MADIDSIVAQLKQTKKGRLKYDQQNWNEIFDETSKTPELRISPFSIKTNSRLATMTKSHSIGNQNRKMYDDKITRRTPSSSSKKDNEPTDRPKNISNKSVEKQAAENKNDRLITPPVSPEHLLHDFNKSYDQALNQLTNLRLQNMKDAINKINFEHRCNLDDINQRSEERVLYGRSQVETHRDSPRESKEISEFVQKRNQRKLVAERQKQQAEMEIKAIEDQRNRLEEMRKAIEEKKALAQRMGDEGRRLVENVVNIANSNKNVNDGYKQLAMQMRNEYGAFLTMINATKSDDGTHIESKYRTVAEKLQFFRDCSSKCDLILKKVEEEKQQEEKRRLEAEALRKKEAAEAEAKRKAEEAQKLKDAASKPAPTSAPPPAYNQATTTASPPSRAVPTPSVQEAAPELVPIYPFMEKALNMFVAKDAFDIYLILRKLVSDTERKHQPMSKSTDATVKKEKFDLFKVVNTQINAISDESPKHLMEKILKLNTLLKNGEVVFSGKKISTKGNETAMALVKDLTAKKLVMQGQSQVASSFKTAFPIAAVCAGIWTLFPDVGDLLLGYFYLKCPYLVPLHFPKTDKISSTEYYQMLGYNVDDGKVEEDDKYLNKLSGYVRLYASIIQMEMPPDLAGRGHPHGLENGWVWFTRVLNLEPVELVTATIIFDFLEVAGHAMLKRFGKQFEKLLSLVKDELMPKINAITPSHAKAGATRLKMFLDSCIKEGNIKPPEGVLTQRWWATGR
ncbi:mRNA export factor GLE1-like isoform X2 [Clytia hemisphaerica]|uniref:mRNA export factor GLE1 n=2 Tax=Clytia hemisphaerica TaxID=252671 RepID=A0A7M5UWB7_9CNID|eukprot:TCONS_00003145-protein